MFYNADSGLYLTQYRTYDPVAGRWLSRDPIGETADHTANLYRYVGGNPVSLNDPSGRLSPLGALVGAAILGGLDLAQQLNQNGGNIGCVNPGEVAAAALLGALLGGAPELAAELAAEEGTTAAEAGAAIAEEESGAAVGAASADGIANSIGLARQLTSEEQLGQVLAGQGTPIMGAGTDRPLLDAERLANEYGGDPSDWAKVRSDSSTLHDVQTPAGKL